MFKNMRTVDQCYTFIVERKLCGCNIYLYIAITIAVNGSETRKSPASCPKFNKNLILHFMSNRGIDPL